jgi:hypothetical protein
MEKDLLTALGFFKDWSNYMLVTTVAALGWVAKVESAGGNLWLHQATIICLAASIVFAVFTLALIPLVGEEIARKKATSMYSARPVFNVLWTIPSEQRLSLKAVCWPQHVLFLAGIGCYVAWTFSKV